MKLIEKLKGSRFWLSVASLSLGQVVAQTVNFLLIPVISRLYAKEAYGDFGVVTSFAAIVMGVIGLGLGSAIMAADDREESEKVFRVCYMLQMMLSTLLCAGLLAVSPLWQAFHTALPYPLALLLLYLYLNLSIHFSLMSVYVNRLGANRVLLLNPILAALCSVFITLPLGLLHMDAWGLFAANLAATALANAHMLRYASPYRAPFRFQDVRAVFAKFRHFVVYQYPANFMGTLSANAPQQMLSGAFGPAALGDYAMCNRVFGLPLQVIAQPIQTVYFRDATQRYRAGQDIACLTFSLVTKIMLAALVPLVTGCSFAEPIFAFVLGEKWRSAGRLAAVLAFPFLFNFCSSCVTYCRVVIGRQRMNLFLTAVHIALVLLALTLGITQCKTMFATVVCYAVAETLYGILDLFSDFYCLKRYAARFLLFALGYLMISGGAILALMKAL